MRKSIIAFILIISMLVFMPSTTCSCDEKQCSTYVMQVLFGDNAYSYESDKKAQMLLNALYMCSEQCNNQGMDKYNQLKRGGVFLPSFASIDVKNAELYRCSHCVWDKTQKNRKVVLQRTINKIFDFGTFNNLFSSNSGKCNSFAALLYYLHILTDYLADDPINTEAYVKGQFVHSFAGEPYALINGNVPTLSNTQKTSIETFIQYSPLDSFGRAGVVFGCIGPEIVNTVGPRQNMAGIMPSGWSFNKYPGIVNSTPAYIYNRCHLLAHGLGGAEQEENLVTGTDYLNKAGMLQFENKVMTYIRETNNHVYYRATPVFKNDNKLVSGVQLEAYSIEDAGKGICFNVYCYNVQPGVNLNYANGNNELSDVTVDSVDILPFAVNQPSDMTPDLFFEMEKHLKILFAEQAETGNYIRMMDQIKTIAGQARAIDNNGVNAAQYIAQKENAYLLLETIKIFLPLLLQKEGFFTSAFSISTIAA